jgi:glycosyltransferase involved in cell wall biosynthesis
MNRETAAFQPETAAMPARLARPRPAQPAIVCVLPAWNEAETLPVIVPEIAAHLSRVSPHVQIIVVDDGSTDATAAVTVALGATHPVTLVRLSRNFGKEAAISAGLDHAEGDVVILMDADGQHPVAVLDAFFAEWRAGHDMVYGVRADRDDETALKRRLTGLFYSLLSRSAHVPIHPDAGDFRLMDRKVVEALRRLPERSRMMKGLYAWVGFPSKAVAFKVAPRAGGRSAFGIRRLSALAVTGFTSFSSTPLRAWILIGAGISLLSILYGVIVVVRTLVLGSDVPGWPTLVAGISFLGGVQLFSIGVLGEYVARIFAEVKARPLYLVDTVIRPEAARPEAARPRATRPRAR